MRPGVPGPENYSSLLLVKSPGCVQQLAQCHLGTCPSVCLSEPHEHVCMLVTSRQVAKCMVILLTLCRMHPCVYINCLQIMAMLSQAPISVRG